MKAYRIPTVLFIKDRLEYFQILARIAFVGGLNLTSHDTNCRQPCNTCALSSYNYW